MLKARRFTTVPTRECCARLEQALSNAKPIAQGDLHRPAVSAIQSALCDLNRGYLSEAEVDGYFGDRTASAVEAFQRDYGLAADGFVARQTLAQLDALYASEVVRAPIGQGVLVGVNSVDPAHYGGDFPLTSCVNDARKMAEISASLGYDVTIFENEQATVSNFTAAVRTAVSALYAGDSLFIFFSGHGSQIPNTDESEADLLDETLCFHDRMMIDDELYSLLAQMRRGVRVHAVFDSCHSGTAYKDLRADVRDPSFADVRKAIFDIRSPQLKALATVTTVTMMAADDERPGEMVSQDVSGQPISSKELTKALDGARAKAAPAAKVVGGADDELASLFADLGADQRTGRRKVIDLKESWNIYQRNKGLYSAIKNVIGQRENQQLACTLVALSACQDSQTTAAGQVYSLFTYNIVSSWSGGYNGSYTQFLRGLKSIAPPDSMPALNTEGSSYAAARAYDRPFVF